VEDYIFYEGTAPVGFEFDYEVSLFNLPEHRLIQSPDGWVSYHILQKRKKLIVAGIHFHIVNRIASSPCRSPFGSVEASAKIEPVTLFTFLEFLESSLIAKGVQKIIIKAPPAIYNYDTQVLLHTFLLNLKYTIAHAEAGAVLMVDKPLDTLLQKWEKRKVRQAEENSLSLKYHSIKDLALLYDFIFACRKKKGYASSMTFGEIQKVVSVFPERFLLTSVYHEGKIVAASISIQSNSQVLYHFYSDHIRPLSDVNPTIFLIKGLYEYALRNKIALLDLGTSSLEGYPNFGLLNFKLRLGATPTPKLTFEKTLTE
jgi:Acetyltransferase (GNAT) domain